MNQLSRQIQSIREQCKNTLSKMAYILNDKENVVVVKDIQSVK